MREERRKKREVRQDGRAEQQHPAPYGGGTGSVPVAPDRAAFDRMGYRERLALKRENPEVYQELKK